MNTIIDFVTLHWGTIVVIAGLIAYAFSHQKLAIEYAKKKSLEIMFSIEKNAEQYLLETGLDKFEYIILVTYPKLPYFVKWFVKEDQFRLIVQELFDNAREYAESHRRTIK